MRKMINHPAPTGDRNQRRSEMAIDNDIWVAVIEKLPEYSPAWPKDLQDRWFEAFGRILELIRENRGV